MKPNKEAIKAIEKEIDLDELDEVVPEKKNLRLKVDNERYEEVCGWLNALRSAVENLYYSAVWHADRPVDEGQLWADIRDAAAFRPGYSPKELPYSGIKVELPISTLRLMACQIRKDRGEFSSEQVDAFLSIYRDDLEVCIGNAVKQFMEEKLK